MTQIKLRRDTSAAFASSNPVLGNGEPAYETDTKKLKIGDGTTAYTQLEYFSAGGGGTGDIPIATTTTAGKVKPDGTTITITDDGTISAVNDGGLELCDTDIVIRDDEKMFTQLQQMQRSTFDKSKFTVVGSPTITDDGVVTISDFNYLQVQNPIKVGISTFEFQFEIKTMDSTGTFQECYVTWNDPNNQWVTRGITFHYGTILGVNANYNTEYKVKCSYKEGYLTTTLIDKITGEIRQNTIEFNTEDLTMLTGSTYLVIGVMYQHPDTNPLNNPMDLKQFSITVDGKEVFSGNKTGVDVINDIEIPYTLSKTGSKIVDVAYRDRVIDLYEQEGQAGYYTIDEPNKNFTLPMGEIYGMIGQRSLISSTVTETNRVDIYSDKTCLICGNVATAGTINLPIELVNNNYFITLSTSAKTATSFTTTATGDYILIGKVI